MDICPQCGSAMRLEVLPDEDAGGNRFDDSWLICTECDYETNDFDTIEKIRKG